MARRRTRRRPILTEDHLFVGARYAAAPLTYWTPDGREVARVHPVDDDNLHELVEFAIDQIVRDIDQAWEVSDRHGPVFSIRRYEAARDPSYDVVVDDDRTIGTFFHDAGLLRDEVTVRDDAAAPVAELEVRDRVHELREGDGDLLAACRRVFDPAGNDTRDEVWSVEIEPELGALDRRVLVAAPLVCHLIGHPKRRFDPDSTLAAALLIAVPPVGGALIVAERVIDGLYWLRRKLD